MNDCLFCKIGRKEIPAALVYEDEQMFVINDIKPQAPLHALVIPKRHIATLNELTGEHDALVRAMMPRGSPRATHPGASDRPVRHPVISTAPLSTPHHHPL